MAAEPKFKLNPKTAVAKKATKKDVQAKSSIKVSKKDPKLEKIKDDAAIGKNPIPVPVDPTKSDI